MLVFSLGFRCYLGSRGYRGWRRMEITPSTYTPAIETRANVKCAVLKITFNGSVFKLTECHR